jgi:hypothetical protein
MQAIEIEPWLVDMTGFPAILRKALTLDHIHLAGKFLLVVRWDVSKPVANLLGAPQSNIYILGCLTGISYVDTYRLPSVAVITLVQNRI